MSLRRAGRCWFLFGAVLALTSGCSSYRLSVHAIESTVGDIRFVDRSESLDDATGVARAEVRLIRDPGSLKEAVVSSTRTGPDGRAVIVLDAFGAGWMDESWRIEVVAARRESVSVVQRLPRKPGEVVLLIELPEGISSDPRRESMDEIIRRYR